MTGIARRLVVSYCFAPYVDTSGTVAAKRVCLRGEPVDLIQNDMGRLRGTDPGLELIAGDLVRRRAALPTVTRFSSWVSVREWCEAGLEQVERWRVESMSRDEIPPGADLPWSTMYSRSHFVASHFLAALVKSEHPEIRWEAEFSDPCSRDATGDRRYAELRNDELLERFRDVLRDAGVTPPDSDNVYEWAETLVFALADDIQFTNENQAGYMIGYCQDPELARRARRHTATTHHPVLPERFYGMAEAPLDLEPSRVHVGYFGNFYGQQSPIAALQGMALLDPELRKGVKLHIFTAPTAPLARRVRELKVEDAVDVQRFLPFLQFLAMAKRMDVLLVVDYPLPQDATRNPFLLSKWGDYKGSGTAIWGILEESSILSAMNDPSLCYRTPVGHVVAAAQLLSQLARQACEPTRDGDHHPEADLIRR